MVPPLCPEGIFDAMSAARRALQEGQILPLHEKATSLSSPQEGHRSRLKPRDREFSRTSCEGDVNFLRLCEELMMEESIRGALSNPGPLQEEAS